MPCPVQPDCQPSRTSCSWLATGIAALAVAVSSGPKMKFAWTWVTHLRTRAAAVAGSDASFSCTRVTLWPITPPALLTMAAQAVAPSSSLSPSWANGPDVAAISQTVRGVPDAALLPPPPELHPAARPATRTAPAGGATQDSLAGGKMCGSDPGIVHQSPLWLRSGLPSDMHQQCKMYTERLIKRQHRDEVGNCSPSGKP